MEKQTKCTFAVRHLLKQKIIDYLIHLVWTKKEKSNLSLKLCINFNYVTKSTFLFRLLIFPTTKLAQKIWKKSYGSAHNCTYPYVLFLVYWVVGIQVNHLWCSVCWSRVSSDLRDKQRIRERNDL